MAAISACDGLKGVFRLSNEDYFIEPLEGVPARPNRAQPHVVYKRQAPRGQAEQSDSGAPGTCGVQASLEQASWWQWRERSEQRRRQLRHLHQPSVSKEKWVETLVVADAKMVEYHGQPQVESYVLTIMNIVAGIFHDPSIGNPIHITVVRLVLLEDEEEDLKVTHHADNTLRSFCKWQKSINMKGDTHPLHHDTAILLTRKDLCASMNQPCETLGLSHVGGMCQPFRSCSVNEDTGLPLAFTVAHELGHSSCTTPCPSPGPAAAASTSPGFSTGGGASAWMTRPPRMSLSSPRCCPASSTTWTTSAASSTGPSPCSARTWTMSVTRCGALWGSPVTPSWTRLWTAPPVERARPKYKGKYCVGERKRLRLCNLKKCPAGQPSFRHIQCSHFDTTFYKGQLHTWVPVVNDENPCELHCRPANESFAEKLRDAVVDGTPCYQGRARASRDLCINGICKNVGCDFEIDSGALEDRCGVCHGDGSTCHTVRETFQEADDHKGYVDVALIPAGARDIRIEELAESTSFLALRSEDPEKYFLNGHWTIQWNGDYEVAGTTFTYSRTGELERLTSPGPTEEPIWIQLLIQESNPGVRYEYTIHRAADPHGLGLSPEFSWTYGPWTKCTVTCGTGIQRQSAHCTKWQAGPVDDRYCDPVGRPDDRQRKCSEEPCPARWWAGEWQPCSHSCGHGGLSRRAVLCIQSVGPEEQRALEPPDCEHLPRPPAESPCNFHVPCPASWAAGNWSQCSATCGQGTQRRTVVCTHDTGVPCDEAQRPASEATCSLSPCPQALDPEGSGSGSFSQKLYTEVSFTHHHLAPHTPSPSPLSNIIEEDEEEEEEDAAQLGPPGPVFVDDFYYDYNFIRFHEDLSYEPFEEPGSDPAGTGDWTPPPLSGPAEPPAGAPEPATELPRDEDQRAAGDPSPRPGQAGHSTPPPSEQIPWSPLGNLLPEEDAPMLAPDMEPPSLPRPPTSVSETPVAPGGHNDFPVGEQGPSQPPPPRWEVTNEVSEDEDEDPEGRPALPLPQTPTASQPEAGGWDPSLGPGTPESPAPGLAPPGLHSPVPPETFLGTAPTGPGHRLWGSTLSPGPSGQPEPPSPEAPPQSALPSTPAVDSPANRSPAPEAQTPDPSLAEEGPPLDLPLTRNASWEVGKWSECSTTCGLGAVWRSVRCSSGREDDCAPAGRPQPARHCHLRPCATWHVGTWSKCSRSCGGGFSVRDVQCVDTQDLRPLRPFHCQAGPAQPPARQPCGVQSCLTWYTSSWRECSEACGGGEQQRLVTCPQPGLCEEALRPNSTQPCNTHPCTQWVVGPWSQCSLPCRGGVRRRLVKCINTQTGLPEEDSDQCGHEPWPEGSQPCGTEDCELAEPLRCERDRLSFAFCETLRLLGRCQLPSVRAQCCLSCPAPGRSRHRRAARS
ncbi:A disintegrin and metalloproteinase with thrombospondin motifs 7 isoform 3-T3 [Glossophaga mutica]